MEGEEAPFLQVNGASVYSDTKEILASILPLSVRIEVGNTTYAYTISSSISTGAYSPSGTRMPYYAILVSSENIEIENSGQTFTINVSLTPRNGTPVTFTETGHSPLSNSITCPDRVYTGAAYQYAMRNAVPGGAFYQSNASLVWSPSKDGLYTTQIYEEGYADAYTKLSDAMAGFSVFYFAVANRDNLPGSEAAALTSDASVTFRTYYRSSDFTNGCLVTEIITSVPVAPRDEVDPSLAPVITDVAVTASPAEAVINQKYVHRQATLTFTPVIQFKYGDTLAYLSSDKSGNRFASSVSCPAIGVTPGDEYVRPDTGATETAGNTSVDSITISAIGNKWRIASDGYLKCYDVLYYSAPRFNTFTIHRCSVSSTTTNYKYGNTYYAKDDFGAYVLIEYEVAFSDLDGTNDPSMLVQYGTHRVVGTWDSNGYGFVVGAAPTTSSMNIVCVLYDVLMPYGVAISSRLSTGAVLADFLAGGRGVAFGKPATEPNAMDISSDWKLLFYQATVGAYDGTARTDLVSWMHDVDTRLSKLES